jgi:signal transduction histidine kinase
MDMDMDRLTESQKNSPALSMFPGGGEMAALMRSHDWSNTPLGPVENWSQSLRTLVSTMLPSRFAQSIFWGEDYIQLYNDAVIPIYGATHPKALGQPARETWAEIWHDQVKPVFESVRTTGEAFFAADQLFHPARFGYLEETYFTLCYSPVRDETGKVSGMLCTSTETTGQVIGQRRLTMLRELAMAVSGAKTRSSVYLTAADVFNPYDIPFALFYQANDQGNWAERVALSGLSADSAAAPREIDLTDRSASWSLGDVLQSREPLLITDVVDRFGSLPVEPWGESPHSAFILPILSGNKEQVECLLVAGISPRLQFNAEYRSFLELVAQQVESSIATARSYEQERQRAEALAELDRAKTTFFNNVSHEFRTPLTLMLAPAEDALTDPDDPLSPNQRQRIEVIQRNGLRLLKLVNTLLDFSRIESDRVQAVYEPTDLATFTAELASVFRSAIERAGLRLVVDCSPLPEPIYVDREMWERIVFNLLSNALKFTFTGEIAVSLRLVNQQVELTVKDTGIGISDAEVLHLFERFHRPKRAKGRTFEGSGIGLSLVQELVKFHGGTIRVNSVEGEGSCFTVSISTGSAHLPKEQVGAERTLTSTAMGAAPYLEEALRWLPEGGERDKGKGIRDFSSHSPFPISHSSSPNARILLVDDNADMRDYVKRLLSDRWQVDTAANGAIALDLIQQQLPDLVLTDVMMPEVDGFQLLKALRADPQTKSIPIILLSARAGEEATVEGLEAGADDYLIKPFSARELMARVETQLQMSRLRQERSTNRLKDEFLSTVTHELNAPLAAILTWARLLQAKPFDRTTTLRALETIERNASNQAKLIEDLLDMFSILAGKRGLNPQPVDLLSIIDDVLNSLYRTAQAKAISLTACFAASAPCFPSGRYANANANALRYGIDDSGLDRDSSASQRIKSDEQLHNLKSKIQNPKFVVSGEPKRLRQIIANVLSNAIKFTPEGGQVKVQLNTDAGVTSLPPKSPNPGGLQSSSSPQSWGARGAEFAPEVVQPPKSPNPGGLQSSSSPQSWGARGDESAPEVVQPPKSPNPGGLQSSSSPQSWGARGAEFAPEVVQPPKSPNSGGLQSSSSPQSWGARGAESAPEVVQPPKSPNSGGLQSSSSPQSWGARGAEFAPEVVQPPKSPNSGGLQSSSSPQSWGARGAKFAQITITDTGIGISADFLPYVFDRFRQAEVPSRHSPGGVGIGLAIARHLVELHGGTIEVASEGEGRGATFTVKLPLI